MVPRSPASASTFRRPAPGAGGLQPSGLVAGSRATLQPPVTVPKDATLPAGVEVGVRWDPVVLAATPLGPPAPGTSGIAGRGAAGRARPRRPGPGPGVASPSPHGRPVPSSSPAPGPTATEPPAIQSVAPEVAGGVVTPASAKLVRSRLRLSVALPATPGLYRLVVTVHGSDGVAYDAATQALIPALERPSQPAAVGRLRRGAGIGRPGRRCQLDLPVRVANDGGVAWAAPTERPTCPTS